MEQLIYRDGELVPRSEAVVSVYDHGLLYGDGIYEGLRCYGGVVFQAEQHLDRLYRSAKCLRLALPDRARIRRAIADTITGNRLSDAYIRLVVSRGAGLIGPDPRSCPQPSVIVIAEPTPPLHGTDAAAGLSAAIVSTRRNAVDATTAQIKSLNYLGSVLAKAEATESGADEAIMLDSRGFVSESPVCNIVACARDTLYTPGESSAILRGITRDIVIGLARAEGMTVEIRDVTPYELFTADEVFLTGTHAELAPVTSVNGITIGAGVPGPRFESLRKRFRELTADPRFGERVVV